MAVKDRNHCKFYVHTSLGLRCVLMPPEEWRVRKAKLIQACLNNGKGCHLLMMYYKKNFKCNSLLKSNIEREVLENSFD